MGDSSVRHGIENAHPPIDLRGAQIHCAIRTYFQAASVLRVDEIRLEFRAEIVSSQFGLKKRRFNVLIRQTCRPERQQQCHTRNQEMLAQARDAKVGVAGVKG